MPDGDPAVTTVGLLLVREKPQLLIIKQNTLWYGDHILYALTQYIGDMMQYSRNRK